MSQQFTSQQLIKQEIGALKTFFDTLNKVSQIMKMTPPFLFTLDTEGGTVRSCSYCNKPHYDSSFDLRHLEDSHYVPVKSHLDTFDSLMGRTATSLTNSFQHRGITHFSFAAIWEPSMGDFVYMLSTTERHRPAHIKAKTDANAMELIQKRSAAV